jgi:transposase InsO family protein
LKPIKGLKNSHRWCEKSVGASNCFDNACAESFFHSLKVEVIHGNRFQTREAMRRTVFEYIAVNYNRMRRSSSIGYLSPESFEAKFAA